ncbi:DUF29 domain-containing protein [Halochromatium roseum]|uniref:DUF29 domain-containing protein n=1 Tax=Halochromatium roseum TaxID=391920 RepID=UPI00191467AF|nr:DUF29 domain-containing protein [Halochromatium roseum]
MPRPRDHQPLPIPTMHRPLRETDDTAAAYDADYYLWLQATRGKLARRDFASVDLTHLLEEIDDLSRREKRKLKNLLRQLLAHLLKLEYWVEEAPRSGNHWRAEVASFRQQIRDELDDSPSLRVYLNDIYEACYTDARDIAAARSQQPLSAFPKRPQLPLEQVLDPLSS